MFLKQMQPRALTQFITLAAGAMLFVVANEMLPETRKLPPRIQRLGAIGSSFLGMLLLMRLGA